MFVLKSDVVPYDELAAALDCLPERSAGLSSDDTLRLWQQWHRAGNLQLGRVERVLADGSLVGWAR